jgi:hypothetical protein
VGGLSFGDTNGTIDKGAFRQAANQTAGSGTITLDYNNGDLFQVTPTGNITIAISNIPTGVAGSLLIKAVNFGAHTITWPTADLWAGGSPPTLTTAGTDHIVVLWENDGTLSFSLRGLDMS